MELEKRQGERQKRPSMVRPPDTTGTTKFNSKFLFFTISNANDTGKSFGTHWADARIHWECTPTVGAAADAEEVPAVMMGGPKSRSSKSKLSSLGFSSGFASFAVGFIVVFGAAFVEEALEDDEMLGLFPSFSTIGFEVFGLIG